VDPRSAAAGPVDDPRGALVQLAEQAGTAFENFASTLQRTRSELDRLAEALENAQLASGLSIVEFGSWARGELTPESDDDWALLAAEPFDPVDPAIREGMEAAATVLGAEGKAPGAQAVFGVPFDGRSLIEQVGLDADTNTNLTRRLLLLLESREVAGDAHEESWNRVLGRYLDYGVKDYRPPRFLLNDLVRYWRTICVDFEGKLAQAGGEDPKWVSRNAKLRTSRKLLFAGGLVPLLLCHLLRADEMPRFLTAWLSATPADRLAAAFLQFDAVEEGARTLAAYDRWLRIMSDAEARAELTRLSAATRDGSALWQDVRTIGREFQQGLLALLFETPLRSIATEYAVF
jgi:hypothetical protein